VNARPRVADVLPDLAVLLRDGLETLGRPELVRQLDGLEITAACACENELCGSFYTVTPMRRWFRRGDEVTIDDPGGAVILDVVGGEIAYVEVLGRAGVRSAVRQAAGG